MKYSDVDKVAQLIVDSIALSDQIKIPRIKKLKTKEQLRVWSVDVVESAIPGISRRVAGRIARSFRRILKLRKHPAPRGRQKEVVYER